MEIRNAVIVSTQLGFEDHGIMTAFLQTRSDTSGQGFGGYSLGGRWGMEFIMAVLKTVGVENWEDLPGKHIRLEADFEHIYRIGNIIEDKWFDPKKDLAQYVPERADF